MGAGPKVHGLGSRDKGCATSQHALHSALNPPLTSAECLEIRVKGVGLWLRFRIRRDYESRKCIQLSDESCHETFESSNFVKHNETPRN